MEADTSKQPKTITDDLDAHSIIHDDGLLSIFRANVRWFEMLLFLLLIIHGFLILVSNDNPPALLSILALLGLNLLSVTLEKRENPSLKLLRAVVSVSVAGVLSVLVIDSANMLVAWFYLILVYYTFTLSSRHQYVVMVAVPLVFTLAYIMNSGERSITEFLIRLSLMIISGGLMGYVQRVVNRSISQRIQLMNDLRQLRDNTAYQLEERTAELQTEIQGREQAQTRLVEERQLLQTIIDTFPSRLFVKDRDSRFTLVNHWSLKRLGLQDDPKAVVGKSDFDFYPHFAERTYASEQQLMETGESIIDWEETTIDDEGVERHYLISKVPMYHSETNQVVGLVGVTTEVTSLKETQIALSESEESLKSFQLRLKALNQIAINLTRIEAFDELVYQSIKQAMEHLGFSRLSCRFLDANNPNKLIGGCRVNKLGEIIMAKYESIILPKDYPLVEMIKGNKPNHIVRDSVVYDANFQPIGHGDKAFSALLDGDTIIGFLYADTLLDDAPFTQSQFELLNLYGATLGSLFNQQRSQEALQTNEEEALHFQQQLKQLNEVTIELESVASVDELCLQTIVLGREKLGFERMGIWLIVNDQPDMRRGMWGIDKHGNLRDERDVIIPVDEREATMIAEGDLIVYENYDTFDFDDIHITIGWNLVGLMWDGTKRIGWVYADNALHGQPLTQNRQELFRLYAATVGLLCGRQMADEQLRQSEIRYRAITEASSDIIAIVDRQFVVTYVSQSLQVVMGVNPQLIIGQSVTQVIHPDDVTAANDLLQQCLQFPHLNTRMDEFQVRHADGHWVHMEAVITSMIDDPVIDGILISCRDLTQRLVAEERKRIVERERERASVLRQFISDISHDFRTPLSTISTNAYLLKRGRAEHIDQRIDMIDQQIERLAKLIDSLSAITRLDETSQIKMEEVNINRILESIPYDRSHDLQEKRLDLRLDLQSHLPMIIGNVSLLQDAVYHLIDNAIQFCQLDDSIVIQSYQDQDYVIIQITDTGTGIAEEDIPFVFDRLYRADKARSTQTGGSGLGLAITRRIMDLHQGTIKISSQLDEGTLVYLLVPFNTATPIDTSNE